MTPLPGPRYGRKPARPDLLRGAQLGVSIRRTETEPVPTVLTDNRRGLLEAIHAGKVRWHAAGGWKCAGRAVNKVVAECVAAGWAKDRLESAMPIRRVITLTELGEQAIGVDE